MARINVYKPRYKLAFQAKSTIWPYKNSRLRRFFNIRGRKLVRRGYFKRYVLVFNNMKWTIARRYIKPYMLKRRPVHKKFKTAFYTKQQLRAFYGKLKEEAFRNFFKNYLGNVSNRNASFFAALERRLDMVLFRMRVLPTIFACHQLVHHKGVYINRRLEKSPQALVRPGDIVSLPKKQWDALWIFMKRRIYFRRYGLFIFKRRQRAVLKKKLWWVSKTVFFKKTNLKLIKTFFKLYSRIKQQRERLKLYVDDLCFDLNEEKLNLTRFNLQTKLQPSLLKFFFLKQQVYKASFKFEQKFKNILKKKYVFRAWKHKQYYYWVLSVLGTLHQFYKQFSSLWLALKQEELNFFLVLFVAIFNELKQKGIDLDKVEENEWKKEVEKALEEGKLPPKWTSTVQKVHELIKSKTKLLKVKNKILNYKWRMYQKALFLQRVQNYKTRLLWRKDQKEGDAKTAGNPLIYFYINRQFKAKRRQRIPRLKKVHWYIPRYIYFEFYTMRGVFLYNPLPQDIIFSFKSSLNQVYSFYRGRGL